MNALTELFAAAAAQRIGWALIHFLWQGAAVALLLAVGLALLRRRSPQARWAACCGALAAMAVLPVATFFVVHPTPQSAATDSPPVKTAYPEDDYWGKGEGPLKVPPEFLNGTATLEQAKAWCRSLVIGACHGDDRTVIAAEEVDLVPGVEKAIRVYAPSMAGSGGMPASLVFARGPAGLRFIGEWSGAWRAAPPDAHGRPRVLGRWRWGGDRATASLNVLTPKGFVGIAGVDLPGNEGSGTDEQRRVREMLFDEPLSQDVLASVFGQAAVDFSPPEEADRHAPAAPGTPMGTAAWPQRLQGAIRPALPWAILVWLAGVGVMTIWHLGGWAQVRRLRHSGTRPVEPGTQEILAGLIERLRIHRVVRLLESLRLAVPVVVGWLRPVILLPVGAIAGLTSDQLEAVLAHELAHVRRCDGLMRLVQAAVETLLFYHPAVWWVSRRIRIESEHCCDDLAVGALCSASCTTGVSPVCSCTTGVSPVPLRERQPGRPSHEGSVTVWKDCAAAYALALAKVAEFAAERSRAARATAGASRAAATGGPAATGGKLLPRIRRLLGAQPSPSGRWTAAVAGALVLTGLAAAVVIYGCAMNGGVNRQAPIDAGADSSPPTQAAERKLKVLSWIELVDKDDLPGGLYCGAPFYAANDHPGAWVVYRLARQFAKTQLDGEPMGPYLKGTLLPVTPELVGRLAGAYTAKGTLEVAEEVLKGDTITIRLWYIAEDRDMAASPGAMVRVSGEKQFKSVYLFGRLPTDLPPGKYTVNVELDEYDRKEGGIVIAPFNSRTRAVRYERLKATYVVHDPAAAPAPQPGVADEEAIGALIERLKQKMPAEFTMAEPEKGKVGLWYWEPPEATGVLLHFLPKKFLGADRKPVDTLYVWLLDKGYMGKQLPRAQWTGQPIAAPEEMGQWRGRRVLVYGNVAESGWKSFVSDLKAALAGTDATTQPAASAFLRIVGRVQALEKDWPVLAGVSKVKPQVQRINDRFSGMRFDFRGNSTEWTAKNELPRAAEAVKPFCYLSMVLLTPPPEGPLSQPTATGRVYEIAGVRWLVDVSLFTDSPKLEQQIRQIASDEMSATAKEMPATQPAGRDDEVKRLIADLAHGNTRWAAVRRLGDLKDARAVKPLCDLLGSSGLDPENMTLVIAALDKIGDRGALAALAEVVRNPPWRVSRGELVVTSIARDVQEAAVRAMARPDHGAAQRLLVERLDAARWGGQEAEFAARMLGALGDRDAVEPLIAMFKVLRPGDYGAARAAVAALLKLDRDAARPVLVRLVMGETAEARAWGWTAAEGLARIGDDRAVDVLIAALKTARAAGTRKAAAQCLGEVGKARAVKPLIAALTDKDVGVRCVAAYSLGQSGDPQAVPALTSALEDPDPEVRKAAAEALERIRQVGAATQPATGPAPRYSSEPFIVPLDGGKEIVVRADVRKLEEAGTWVVGEDMAAFVARCREALPKVADGDYGSALLGELHETPLPPEPPTPPIRIRLEDVADIEVRPGAPPATQPPDLKPDYEQAKQLAKKFSDAGVGGLYQLNKTLIREKQSLLPGLVAIVQIGDERISEHSGLYQWQNAAAVLGGIGDRRATPFLLDRFWRTDKPEWRLVSALGDLGAEEIVPDLVKWLHEDRYWSVYSAAYGSHANYMLEALQKITGKDFGAVIGGNVSANEKHQKEILAALDAWWEAQGKRRYVAAAEAAPKPNGPTLLVLHARANHVTEQMDSAIGSVIGQAIMGLPGIDRIEVISSDRSSEIYVLASQVSPRALLAGVRKTVQALKPQLPVGTDCRWIEVPGRRVKVPHVQISQVDCVEFVIDRQKAAEAGISATADMLVASVLNSHRWRHKTVDEHVMALKAATLNTTTLRRLKKN